MEYVGPAGPVWLASAPLSATAEAPVLRHVGATTTVALGWYTPLPAASTASACGATEIAVTVRLIGKLRVKAPETPCAWKLYVPAVTPAPTLTVSALAAAPLGAGVTVGGT